METPELSVDAICESHLSTEALWLFPRKRKYPTQVTTSNTVYEKCSVFSGILSNMTCRNKMTDKLHLQVRRCLFYIAYINLYINLYLYFYICFLNTSRGWLGSRFQHLITHSENKLFLECNFFLVCNLTFPL